MKQKLLYFFLITSVLFAKQALAQKESYADEIFATNHLGGQEPKLSDHISFYPNPIKDKFSITNETGIAIVRIEIHSIVGNRVKVIFISASNDLKNIYLDDLKRGIYFATIYFEDEQVLTQKILKK